MKLTSKEINQILAVLDYANDAQGLVEKLNAEKAKLTSKDNLKIAIEKRENLIIEVDIMRDKIQKQNEIIDRLELQTTKNN